MHLKAKKYSFCVLNHNSDVLGQTKDEDTFFSYQSVLFKVATPSLEF